MRLADFLNAKGATAADLWTQAKATMQTANRQDVVDAFEIECRMPERVWTAVWAVLPAALALGTWAALRDAVRLVFNSQTRCAPALPSTPSPKGRALTAGRLLELMRAAGLFATRADEVQFLNTLRPGGASPIPDADRLYDCGLGANSMWSTFDAAIPGGDPFRGCTGSAADVRTAFGLPGPTGPDDYEMVLCTYKLPPGVAVHPPTLADAYAGRPGGGWHDKYLASGPTTQWGQTSGGRPEVVHEVIAGRHLAPPPAVPSARPLRLVS